MSAHGRLSPSPPKTLWTARRRQGLFCVWHGLNRSGWQTIQSLAAGSPKGYRLRRASLSAISALNSWHEWWEEQFFGRRIDATAIVHPPVFILGHWRSGTTLMHNLLALDPQVTFPNLYQVMFPGHFLLTERITGPLTGWALPKTRPMDNVATGWRHSQEDEVALLMRTQMSPYNMLVQQGQPERYRRFFDLTELTADELARWKHEFLRLMKKLTLRANKPIVLKSPSHTYRIPLLLELFPQARFIYICRDPYAVYSSTMHLRQTLFTENALSAPCFDGLEEDTFWTYDHCIRRYEATKHLIPAGHLHELRFEDLEADPLGEMQRVYAALQLPGWEQMEPRVRAELPKHSAYRKNTFPLDQATIRRIDQAWHFAFETYGYPSRRKEPAKTVA